jgi:hypothetical protein
VSGERIFGQMVDVNQWKPNQRVPSEHQPDAYFAVGITNSAPLPMLSGQRCMIDFCLV